VSELMTAAAPVAQGFSPVSDALVIFGVTGDLAYKKIFPALQGLVTRGQFTAPIVGVGRGIGAGGHPRRPSLRRTTGGTRRG